MTASRSAARGWWDGMTAYQIYPKSFMDSNGDGVGDLRGVISRLDYLAWLGVELIWLCPIFVSPMVDQGYDIADYEDVDPVFGTLADLDELIAAAHGRGLRLILDLVVNHCSSEHPWFKQALADPLSEERSCFYFVRGHNGRPPDNLRSYFGGSVWSPVPGEKDTWYLHSFAPEQPDLNWYSPRLRERVYAIIERWFRRGVDGFRIDAIMNIAKDRTFPGLPPDGPDGLASAARMAALHAAEVPGLLREMHERTFRAYDRFSVAEAFGVPRDRLGEFIAPAGCFSTLFDFSVREAVEAGGDYVHYARIDFDALRDATFRSQAGLSGPGSLALVLENHDEPRCVSFFLPERLQNAAGAKILAVFLLMLRGLPFIYQGQELGLTNTRFDAVDELEDLLALSEYRGALGQGLSEAEALRLVAFHTRDNARTPMPWTAGENAGFTRGRPWLKLHQDCLNLNAESQLRDPGSTLALYRRLIALRRSPGCRECLVRGRFIPRASPPGTAVYRRSDGETELMVLCNCSESALRVPAARGARVLIRTDGPEGTLLEEDSVAVPAGTAAVVRLPGPGAA